MPENMFTDKENLKNESNVEQFFVIRLLKFLGYGDKSIKTKSSLKELVIGRGSRKENYKPDYVCFHGKKPKIVIDAKDPEESLEKYTYQVSGYALGLNKKFKGENPVRFTALTNGFSFKLYNWDEEEPILVLDFNDFKKGEKKLDELINLISFEEIKDDIGKDEITLNTFISKPSVEEVKSVFNKCHNIIWKKEKISPTDAFYEFSKIIFVKLNEDRRLREIIESGKKLERKDFKFSLEWLSERETETENPLSSILFKELQGKLQEEIERNNKKPIFLEDEGIDLKSPTIKEIVRLMQNYDLYTIDEDLNGRMFETFLNATIRGRELGQYFTPRKVVKFMTKLANLKVTRKNDKVNVDSILDACCGSGGFLIDAMTDLTEKVKENPSLSPYKKEILEEIRTNSIFGIEANPKISRIARMNMYVHGDGGSRIYCADSLDKKIKIKKGTNREMKKELEELKEIMVSESKKFDVVLTNPPFSMSYQKKDKDEKTILEQYEISYADDKLSSSIKSNILFIARYSDLLDDKGKMLIIIDNSVLNSYSHKEYRNYIRNNFIIKAVFQLPTHTFVNQQAGGITSILFLEKRKNESQEQPPIFARVIKNVGHSKSGKELSFDDFSDILKEYRKYEDTGKLFLKGEKQINEFENDDLFLIKPEKIDDRIDVFFHQPSYYKLLASLKKSEKDGKLYLKKLSDFNKIENIKTDKTEDEKTYKYIEIGSIDKERGFIADGEWEEGIREELSGRAKLLIKENDLLFSKPFRSLKKVVMIPRTLNNQLASSGFYGLRPKDYAESCILWAIFRSRLIQKQLFHLCSGYTQRELNNNYIEDFLIIPIPKNKARISNKIDENIKKAKEYRKKEIEAIRKILEEAEKML